MWSVYECVQSNGSTRLHIVVNLLNMLFGKQTIVLEMCGGVQIKTVSGCIQTKSGIMAKNARLPIHFEFG